MNSDYPGEKHKNYNVRDFFLHFVRFNSSHIFKKEKWKLSKKLYLKMDPWNLTNSGMYFHASFAVRLPTKTVEQSNDFHEHPHQHQTREILSILKFP